MEDLIKRSDAIDAVICRTTFKSEDAIMAMMTIVGEVMNNIANLPSADRPQGEWIDNGDRYFRCSLCGTKDTDKWHWCHGCGAKMKGADDE